MNVKELKEAIADLPDSMEVFIGERKSEFKCGLLNSATVREINFTEEPYGDVIGTDNALVLEDE